MSRDDQLRAGLVKLLGEVVADVAAALESDRLVREIVRAPTLLGRRLDRAEHTVRRDRRRIARTAGEAADVVGLHVHVVHVRRARADVFRRDVATAEAFDETSVRAEDHFAVGRLVVADDHRLAAAEIETGDRVLVRHAARETQRVDDRFLVGGIVPKARAAERRSENRAVNGDDSAISRRRILTEHELLVPHGGDGVEKLHWRIEEGGLRAQR